jgi:hypothetical protein
MLATHGELGTLRCPQLSVLLLQPLSAAEPHRLPTNNDSEVAATLFVCCMELAAHTWTVLTRVSALCFKQFDRAIAVPVCSQSPSSC